MAALLLVLALAAGLPAQAQEDGPSTTEQFEEELLNELAAAGLHGRIATDGFNDAEAYVEFDGGEVFIHTHAIGDTTHGRPATYNGATVLGGVSVQTGTWQLVDDEEGDPAIWQFLCIDKKYEVVGDGELPLNSVEAFITAFTTHQPCGEPDTSISPPGEIVFDGDPSTLDRIDADDPIRAAVTVSNLRFPDDHAKAQIVLARVDTFADALAGAPLTTTAPLLFSYSDHLPEATLQEIQRVATPDATIYLLGGDAALSSEIQQQLTDLGYQPKRLAGPSRVETSVAIARAVPVDATFPLPPQIAIARAYGTAADLTAGWADSISGGAWATHVPTAIVLTPTDNLHPAVEAFVQETQPTRTFIFGGDKAINQSVEEQLPNPARLAGPERATTASNLVGLYGNDVERFIIVNGYRSDGWTFGLLAAGIAATAQAPVLYSHTYGVPQPTLDRTEPRSGSALDILLLGGDDHLSTKVAEEFKTEG